MAYPTVIDAGKDWFLAEGEIDKTPVEIKAVFRGGRVNHLYITAKDPSFQTTLKIVAEDKELLRLKGVVYHSRPLYHTRYVLTEVHTDFGQYDWVRDADDCLRMEAGFRKMDQKYRPETIRKFPEAPLVFKVFKYRDSLMKFNYQHFCFHIYDAKIETVFSLQSDFSEGYVWEAPSISFDRTTSSGILLLGAYANRSCPIELKDDEFSVKHILDIAAFPEKWFPKWSPSKVEIQQAHITGNTFCKAFQKAIEGEMDEIELMRHEIEANPRKIQVMDSAIEMRLWDSTSLMISEIGDQEYLIEYRDVDGSEFFATSKQEDAYMPAVALGLAGASHSAASKFTAGFGGKHEEVHFTIHFGWMDNLTIRLLFPNNSYYHLSMNIGSRQMQEMAVHVPVGDTYKRLCRNSIQLGAVDLGFIIALLQGDLSVLTYFVDDAYMLEIAKMNDEELQSIMTVL
ncbi:MAG: hypothetical protein D6698_16405 [Gammaproteobacteria bacterium]|nr:MAG: hypothetical protein D6698_16405 [Gammaproteobacteria bacterium]